MYLRETEPVHGGGVLLQEKSSGAIRITIKIKFLRLDPCNAGKFFPAAKKTKTILPPTHATASVFAI